MFNPDECLQHRAGLRKQALAKVKIIQDGTWLATSEVYLGTGAEMFSDAFVRADARFTDYLDRGHRILAILQDKMEQLRRFDESDGRSV